MSEELKKTLYDIAYDARTHFRDLLKKPLEMGMTLNGKHFFTSSEVGKLILHLYDIIEADSNYMNYKCSMKTHYNKTSLHEELKFYADLIDKWYLSDTELDDRAGIMFMFKKDTEFRDKHLAWLRHKYKEVALALMDIKDADK